MRVGECYFCSGLIKFKILDPVGDTGQWRHQDGSRKCGVRAQDVATPRSGTVKRTVEDVQVTNGRV